MFDLIIFVPPELYQSLILTRSVEPSFAILNGKKNFQFERLMENTQSLTTIILQKISGKNSDIDSADIQINGYTPDYIINYLKICIKVAGDIFE